MRQESAEDEIGFALAISVMAVPRPARRSSFTLGGVAERPSSDHPALSLFEIDPTRRPHSRAQSSR